MTTSRRRPLIPVRWAAVLILSGCGSSGPPPAPVSAAPVEPAPLAPGDAIDVSFSREPEQSGTYAVDETFRVGLPFLGARSVEGVRPSDLRADLMAEYEARLRNQTIDLRILRRVRVLGSVLNPGLYRVDATMSLADVVAEAGGATPDGDLNGVQVMHEDGTVSSQIGISAGAFTDLRSGDEVFVPQRSWVSRNGVVLLSATVSAFAIIAAAALYN